MHICRIQFDLLTIALIFVDSNMNDLAESFLAVKESLMC